MSFLESLRAQRQKFLDGVEANQGDINLDIFEDFYPDKAHFVYELLQNAEDVRAKHIKIELHSDKLIVEHDGEELFSEANVGSITGIHSSTKKEEKDKIGKFGIGFKSVFAYTDAPEIYSGKFNFRITQYILPNEIRPVADLGSKTRFVFPFNASKKPAHEAFRDIQSRLSELSDLTLLFLSNISSITWKVVATLPVPTLPRVAATQLPQRGELSRIEHRENLIEVRKTSASSTSSFWLRYSETCEADSYDGIARTVAIAFALKTKSSGCAFQPETAIAEQMKITPATPGKVCVFFPAAKESSGLLFHVHAPFVPELSRASIKDTPVNAPLYSQIAKLTAKSLHRIRDLGLLTEEFLAVLPNDKDELEPYYRPIRQAILDEMQNDPLVPTLDDKHAPAGCLIRTRTNLRFLLSELSKPDLAFIVGSKNEDIHWAIDLTESPDSIRERRLLTNLAVRQFKSEEFLQRLDEGTEDGWKPPLGEQRDQYPPCIDWLKRQSLDWHRKMYAVLYHEVRKPIDDPDPCCGPRIIRLQNEKYDQGKNCFFPSDKVPQHTTIPLVKKAVFSSLGGPDDRDAKAFLVRAGVEEVQERNVIEADLKERYSDPNKSLDDDTYLADLKRFIAFRDANKSEVELFSATFLFKDFENKRRAAEDIYLDDPYEPTLLRVYYDSIQRGRRRVPLSKWYLDHSEQISGEDFVSFLKAVGVQTKLAIIEKRCDENTPDWFRLSRAQGTQSKNEKDSDWYIPHLASMLDRPSLEKATLIWQTMRKHANEKTRNILKAVRRMNNSADAETSDSTLVGTLRSKTWVPQDHGHFAIPADASPSQLPPGWLSDADRAWITAIGFGTTAIEEAKRNDEEHQRRRQAANALGWPAEAGELLAELRNAGMTVDDLKQLITGPQPCDLPQKMPPNPELVIDRMKREAPNAPRRGSEPKTRHVDVERDEVKKKAHDYLQGEYTNPQRQMICQICQDELPFKYRASDGTEKYFFEAVELFDANQVPLRWSENYLALCPNHAAMFVVANDSENYLRPLFENMKGQTLAITLAKKNVTVYFTESHLCRLRAILDLD